jgi:hypothetical protein
LKGEIFNNLIKAQSDLKIFLVNKKKSNTSAKQFRTKYTKGGGPVCMMNAEQFSCDPDSQAICVLHEILGEPRCFHAQDSFMESSFARGIK